MAGSSMVVLKKGDRRHKYKGKAPQTAKLAYKGRYASTGLKSLLGNSKFLNLIWKAGYTQNLLNGETSQSACFRLNSIHDPDATSGPLTKNTSAEGVSQLAFLYGRYQVYYCTAIITVCNMSEIPVRVVFSPGNPAAPATDFATTVKISDIAERQNSKTIVVGGADGSESVKTFKYRVNLRKVEGLTKATYSQDGFSAALDTNPTNLISGYISWGWLTDQAVTSTQSVNIAIKFIFGTRLYDAFDAL